MDRKRIKILLKGTAVTGPLPSSLSLKDLGEKELLSYISSFLDTGELPFDEDAVAISLDAFFSPSSSSSPSSVSSSSSDSSSDPSASRQCLIVNSDMLVESTDLPPPIDFWHAGWKAVTMSVSDLAAKGALPRFLVVSLGIPGTYSTDALSQVIHGIHAAAKSYKVAYLGGDLNEARELIVDCTVVGFRPCSRLLLRSSAQIGDYVFVTGPFGFQKLALLHLLQNVNLSSKLSQKQVDEILHSFLHPVARVKEGQLLSTLSGVHACLDSSDGLARSLAEISRLSNVGILLYRLPTFSSLPSLVSTFDLSLEDLVLYGGEEFELIFTVSPSLVSQIDTLFQRAGFSPPLLIGKIVEGSGLLLNRSALDLASHSNADLRFYIDSSPFSRFSWVQLSERGFQHFQ